jgi:hypothetical protein
MAESAVPARGLNPDEALARWSDRFLYTEMIDCEDAQEYRWEPTPEGEMYYSRHQQYHARHGQLKNALVELLRSGSVLASGMQEHGLGREVIRPDVWSTADLDFHLHAIAAQGNMYYEAELFDASAIPLNIAESPYWYASWRERILEARKALPSAPATPPRILFSVAGHKVELSIGLTLSRRESEFFMLLLPQFEADDRAGKSATEYGFTPTIKLKRGEDEERLRQRVYRLRQRIAAAYRDRYAMDVAENAVIESVTWQGYRLNPALVQVWPQKIRAG